MAQNVHQKDDPKVENCRSKTPIESIRLAQLRANRKCAKRYSDFYGDESVLVRPQPANENSGNLVSNHLINLYRSKILCDLSVKLGEKVYSVHKVALTSHSKKYLDMFGDPTSSVSEIHIEDVAPEVVEKVLEYLYTSHIDICEKSVGDIIRVCDQLEMKDLREKCINFLGTFTEKNVFLFLRLSRHHLLLNLVRRMRDFVAEKINTIHLGSHFELLDIEDVYAILSSDIAHRRIKSEKRLLRIGLKWLQSCEPPDARKVFAAKVLECVALDKVRPKEICKQLNAVPFVFEDSECVTILRKAFRHHVFLGQNNVLGEFSQNGTKDCNVSFESPLIGGDNHQSSIIVIGGVADSGEAFEAGDQVLKFSFSSSKWTKSPSLSTRRSGHGVAFVNGSIFVIGGFIHITSSPIPKLTEIVDCYNDELTRWHGVSSMSVKRALFALAQTDGHIYVFGGETEGCRPTESCECYSVKTDQWTTIEPLSIGRLGAMACQHNEFVYVIGGIIEDAILSLVETYDLSLKRWSSRCPLPYGRCFGSLAHDADSLFYLGGVGHDNCSSELRSEATVFQYNLLRDHWVERTRLPNPRHFASTAFVDDKIYMIGGFSTETWEYFADIVCYCCKRFQSDTSSVTPLPHGLMKTAAVGIFHLIK